MAREREERLMGHAISPWSAIATETSGIVGGEGGRECPSPPDNFLDRSRSTTLPTEMSSPERYLGHIFS